jgi:hypothetical protein
MLMSQASWKCSLMLEWACLASYGKILLPQSKKGLLFTQIVASFNWHLLNSSQVPPSIWQCSETS